LYTPSIGGVQRLPNGNTLIDFGNLQQSSMGSIVTEVDANNQIVFQLEYADGGNLYRAQKFDWFFDTPPNPTWNCIGGACIDAGTGTGAFTDSLQCVTNCAATHLSNLKDLNTVKLIKITDGLGREKEGTKNEPLFYIYDDGTVEKKIIIE
jgi:hypothetical protein